MPQLLPLQNKRPADAGRFFWSILAQYLIVQPYALEVAAVTALPLRASVSAAAT